MSTHLRREDHETGLHTVSPDTHLARDAVHFRRIVAARAEVARAEADLREAVAKARETGDSWIVIGAALGVSKQAAHKRFASSPDTLGHALTTVLEGPEWDLPSLAEAADVTVAEIRRFADDRLDLADRRDVRSLVSVIRAIKLPAPLERVRASLQVSPGGLRRVLDGPKALAARSRAHVSDEERQRDIQRGLAEFDEDPSARDEAARRYLNDLERELDALE